MVYRPKSYEGFFRESRPGFHSTYSLFIDNLDFEVGKEELFDIFSEYGHVSDVYISGKRRLKNNLFFGFVRYVSEHQAIEAARKTNGMLLHGKRLFVKQARFGKQATQRVEKAKGFDSYIQNAPPIKKGNFALGFSRSYAEAMKQALRKDDDNQNHQNVTGHPSSLKGGVFFEKRKNAIDLDLRTIEGTVCVENLVWLKKSLVIEVPRPVKSEEASRLFNKIWPTLTKITDLGRFKFFISFDSIEDLDVAIVEGVRDMSSFGVKIRKWSASEVCKERDVWIEIWGLPPHAWSRDNMCLLVKDLGNIIDFHDDSEFGKSMESAKVRIHTKFMPFIEDNLLIAIEGDKYEVFIKEVDWKPILVEEKNSQVSDEDSSSFVEDSFGEVAPGSIEMMEVKKVQVDSEIPCHNNCKDLNIEVSNNSILEKQNGHMDAGDGLNKIHDDVCHLPSVDSRQVDEFRSFEDGWLREVESNKTEVANVAFNLEQEEEITSNCLGGRRGENAAHPTNDGVVLTEEDFIGPPGFSSFGPQQVTDPITRNGDRALTPVITPKRRRGRPRKSASASTKKHGKAEVNEDCVSSSDNFHSNDEMEARATWALGKSLGFCTSNEEMIIQAFK